MHEEVDDELDATALELRRTLGAIFRRLRQTREPGEIGFAEGSALARLSREGPLSATALARAERVSAQSMGGTVARLVERGLVARSGDPRDRRRVILALTESGNATVTARRAARDMQLTRAFGALTAVERAALAAALPALAHLLREL